jgi:hypothetical protein
MITLTGGTAPFQWSVYDGPIITGYRCFSGGWPLAHNRASEKMEYSPRQTIPKLIPTVPKRTVSSSPNPVTGVSTPPKPGFAAE